MKQTQQFTALIERGDDDYVSLCPELDIASQGDTVEDAKNNLIEAIELFLEVADPTEVAARAEKSWINMRDASGFNCFNAPYN